MKDGNALSALFHAMRTVNETMHSSVYAVLAEEIGSPFEVELNSSTTLVQGEFSIGSRRDPAGIRLTASRNRQAICGTLIEVNEMAGLVELVLDMKGQAYTILLDHVYDIRPIRVLAGATT